MAGMTCGTRRFGAASLLVAMPTALPDRMHSKVREIHAVHVPEASRGQGLASELLNRTVREAKLKRTLLMLTVDEDSLEHFYARFGFRAIQRDPILMVHP